MARRLLAGLPFFGSVAATMTVEHQRYQKRSDVAIAISAPQRSQGLVSQTSLNRTIVSPLQSPAPPTSQALKSSADAARAAADAAVHVDGNN
jgi:hypothetical protein